MSETTDLGPLPEPDDEDLQFLHYNPNTSDIVEWIKNYARAYAAAEVEKERRHWTAVCDSYADENQRLSDKAEQAKADAERYRWLRDQADPDSGEPYVTIHTCNSWGRWFNTVEAGPALDEAIDAAIRSQP